jgi:hypothetical protein
MSKCHVTFPDHVVIHSPGGSQGATFAAQALLNSAASTYSVTLLGRHEYSMEGYSRVSVGNRSVDTLQLPGGRYRWGRPEARAGHTLFIDPTYASGLSGTIGRTPDNSHVAYSQNGFPSHLGEKKNRNFIIHTLVSKITTSRSPGAGTIVAPGGILLIDEQDIHIAVFHHIFKDQGFFKIQTVPDIRAAQFEKIAINCALNVSATVSGMSLGELNACARVSRRCSDQLEGLVAETCAVAAALGIRCAHTADVVAAMYSLMANNPDHRTSMRRAFEAGNVTEIDVLNGAIVRLGRQCGIATPVNEHMVARLAALETAGRRGGTRPAAVSPGRVECPAA